jgi:hypothetical protein
MTPIRWVGPYQLRALLECCMTDSQPWPPDSNGVYVVSSAPWIEVPKRGESILYAGSNSSQSALFVVRVGSLIADMLGFFTELRGHHSGGQSLWKHCRDEGLHPLDLFLGWVDGIRCSRCAEAEVHGELSPLLSKIGPARCKIHSPPVRECFVPGGSR